MVEVVKSVLVEVAVRGTDSETDALLVSVTVDSSITVEVLVEAEVKPVATLPD